MTDGRPRIYTKQDERLPTMTIRVTFWHIRMARKIGGGNASNGVRIALEKASEECNDIGVPRPIRQDK